MVESRHQVRQDRDSDSDSGLKAANAFDRQVRRVRQLILALAAATVFFIAVPDFLFGMLDIRGCALDRFLDVFSVFFMGMVMLLVMVQIRLLTKVVTSVLVGTAMVGFVTISRSLRFADHIREWTNDFWSHLYYYGLQNTMTSLGILLFVGGMLYSIVELLTARKRAEEEHRELRREMAERKRAARIIAEQQLQIAETSRLASLGFMAGGVAHEINNPLAVISTAAQQLEFVLAREPQDDERIRQLVRHIDHNTERIQDIIRGLRGLSRDGSSDPFQEVPVSRVINDTLDMCRARFVANGVALDAPDPPSDLTVVCRPTQISQVLLNLLHNAFDAVVDAPEKRVRLEVREAAGDAIEVVVSDTGPGIPAPLREKILEPFFSTKRGKGTGLGLSVSRSLVESHGGSLTVGSCEHGASMTVRLPKHQPGRDHV